MIVAEFLDDGIKHIDKRFGEGYAKANPVLLAAFIQAAVTDRGADRIANKIAQVIDEDVAGALVRISDAR